MMKLFAVRDVKADAFVALHPMQTKGLMVRDFRDACLDPKTNLNRFPQDYMLYEMGTYDPNSGKIEGYAVPIFIASASDMLEQAKREAAKLQPELPVEGEVVK